MPVLNLLAHPPHEWPDLLLDLMHDPAAAPGGALFDAIEADDLLLEKRGRPGAAVLNHMKLADRQNRAGELWRGFAAGHVLLLTLAAAQAGEKRKGIKAARSAVQSALRKRVGWRKGAGMSELKTTWQNFRPVAHFWAAQNLRPRPMRELREDPPLFLVWLAVAEDLRRRGEAFRPLTGKTPILDPCTMWRMPAELALPEVKVKLPSVDTIISKIKSGG